MEDEEMVKMLCDSSSDPPLVETVEAGSMGTCLVALESSADLMANTMKVAGVLNLK